MIFGSAILVWKPACLDQTPYAFELDIALFPHRLPLKVDPRRWQYQQIVIMRPLEVRRYKCLNQCADADDARSANEYRGSFDYPCRSLGMGWAVHWSTGLQGGGGHSRTVWADDRMKTSRMSRWVRWTWLAASALACQTVGMTALIQAVCLWAFSPSRASRRRSKRHLSR